MTGSEQPSGGWAQYGPPETPEELWARRESFRRAREIEDARLAAEHRATFGEPDDYTVDSAVMRPSGSTVEWRSDGYYRVTRRDEEMPQNLRTWLPWRPDLLAHTREVQPGDRDTPTWWLYFAAARPEQSVRLALSDGTQVPVVRVGWLWAGEVVSKPREAHVTIDDSSRRIPMRRPHYLGPARHPFQP